MFVNNDIYITGPSFEIGRFSDELEEMGREKLHEYSHKICSYESITISEKGFDINCAGENKYDSSNNFRKIGHKLHFELPKDYETARIAAELRYSRRNLLENLAKKVLEYSKLNSNFHDLPLTVTNFCQEFRTEHNKNPTIKILTDFINTELEKRGKTQD